MIGLTSICLLGLSLGGYCVFNKEQISLTVKGKEVKVSTFKNTVKDLLDENSVKYDSNDKITPSLDSKLTDNMKIKVIDISKKQEREYEDIAFEVKLVDDKNLLKGKTEVEAEGELGKKELVYDLTYHDGKLVEKKLINENISKDPVDKIVKKGAKEEFIVASRGSNSRRISVEATAYSGDGITSTGTIPKWGTIAVDPRIIPYGSKVYIPQFNKTFTAEDCGGAIKGNIIDIFMGSNSEAYKWGRRRIDIYVTN
ncbi:3D domain-containing protein [[Clostridium] dakarense]|uniref:3D domain-containing protein n=1 Tax=Faecalimicrobium dakarense TaxID=1301100 RepID=UPI0004B151C9|nr:3D domain-containing protein [[Clostridium] dakarense]